MMFILTEELPKVFYQEEIYEVTIFLVSLTLFKGIS